MGQKTHHNGEIFVGDLFVDSRFMCFSFFFFKLNNNKKASPSRGDDGPAEWN